MRLPRVAPVAITMIVLLMPVSDASAQIFDNGRATCRWCGHSERDTQRYVNWFLNELFFYPGRVRQATARTAISVSLYLFTATFDIHGSLSPSRRYDTVTIAITAEVKKGIPSGRYIVTATTPGGKTSTKPYAIGNKRFSLSKAYAKGAVRNNGSGGRGGGGTGRSGPPPSDGGGSNRRPRGGAKCSRSRRVDVGNETILFCSRD